MTILFCHHKNTQMEQDHLEVLKKSNQDSKILTIGFKGGDLIYGSIEIPYPDFAPKTKDPYWEWASADLLLFYYSELEQDENETLVFIESDCFCDVNLKFLEKYENGKIGPSGNKVGWRGAHNLSDEWLSILKSVYKKEVMNAGPLNGIFTKTKYAKLGLTEIKKSFFMKKIYCELRAGTLLKHFAVVYEDIRIEGMINEVFLPGRVAVRPKTLIHPIKF